MSSKKSTNEYLKRLKNGEKCLDDFFGSVSGYVKYVAYKYLVNKSFTDDVVMNTFCKVLDYIQGYDESQNGMAWISKIAQNEAYNINRREFKQNHMPLAEISEEIASTTDDTGSLLFTADLHNAINCLDETDRRIVEFRVFYDMTYEEIAQELNMYVGTVHKRYTKSIKKIKDEIL